MQYVVAHEAIHPRDICVAFHLCPHDNTTASSDNGGHKKMRIHANPKNHAPQEAFDKVNNLLREKPADKGEDNKLEATLIKTMEKDALTLLQFGDAHFDMFYSEVYRSNTFIIIRPLAP